MNYQNEKSDRRSVTVDRDADGGEDSSGPSANAAHRVLEGRRGSVVILIGAVSQNEQSGDNENDKRRLDDDSNQNSARLVEGLREIEQTWK